METGIGMLLLLSQWRMVYAGNSRWFYISYIPGGEALEFSTDKAYGKGNFAKLKKAEVSGDKR